MIDLEITETYIRNIFEDYFQGNTFLARCGLIRNRQWCNVCEETPRLNYIRSQKSLDGYIWTCKKPCRLTRSIRAGSYFSNSRLSFYEIFIIFHKYLKGETYEDISYELNRSRHTVSCLSNLARDVISNFLINNNQKLGGVEEDGRSKVVEIDESKFFTRKYNVGRIGLKQWYVGDIERGTKKCFILPVSNRNSDTMTRIIMENVEPGTTIIIDKWIAYTKVLSMMPQMIHLSVNHSLNFIDPEDSTIHTQNIEGLWSRSKYYLRKRKGISIEIQSEFLVQFLWEYSIEKRKRLNNLLLLLNWINST